MLSILKFIFHLWLIVDAALRKYDKSAEECIVKHFAIISRIWTSFL